MGVEPGLQAAAQNHRAADLLAVADGAPGAAVVPDGPQFFPTAPDCRGLLVSPLERGFARISAVHAPFAAD